MESRNVSYLLPYADTWSPLKWKSLHGRGTSREFKGSKIFLLSRADGWTREKERERRQATRDEGRNERWLKKSNRKRVCIRVCVYRLLFRDTRRNLIARKQREREREKKRRERASWKNGGIAPRDVFALVAEREILRRWLGYRDGACLYNFRAHLLNPSLSVAHARVTPRQTASEWKTIVNGFASR